MYIATASIVHHPHSITSEVGEAKAASTQISAQTSQVPPECEFSRRILAEDAAGLNNDDPPEVKDLFFAMDHRAGCTHCQKPNKPPKPGDSEDIAIIIGEDDDHHDRHDQDHHDQDPDNTEHHAQGEDAEYDTSQTEQREGNTEPPPSPPTSIRNDEAGSSSLAALAVRAAPTAPSIGFSLSIVCSTGAGWSKDTFDAPLDGARDEQGSELPLSSLSAILNHDMTSTPVIAKSVLPSVQTCTSKLDYVCRLSREQRNQYALASTVIHSSEKRQDTIHKDSSHGLPPASSEHEAPASPSLEMSIHLIPQSNKSSHKRIRPLVEKDRVIRRSQRAKKDSWKVKYARKTASVLGMRRVRRAAGEITSSRYR